MTNAALVAINIYCNDNNKQILLNQKSTPILYYWNIDSEQSFIDSIIGNEQFCNLIKEKVVDANIYSNTQISYIYYILSGKEEKFIVDSFKFQDHIKLSFFNGLIDKTLDEIAKYIYFDVFHAEYVERNEDPIIYDVYAKSNLINKEQLSIGTFLNYVRSVAYNKFKLSNENLDELHNRAAEIIDKTQKYHEHIG
jgi:hypothetical protein